jgi:hypothetical protein
MTLFQQKFDRRKIASEEFRRSYNFLSLQIIYSLLHVFSGLIFNTTTIKSGVVDISKTSSPLIKKTFLKFGRF